MSNNEIREKRKKVICDLVKDDFYVPMKEKELAMFLQVSKEDREEFREILQELLAEGKLTLTVKGKYMKSNGKVLTGTFISNAKGFGFVEVEGRICSFRRTSREEHSIRIPWKWHFCLRRPANARKRRLSVSLPGE